MSKKAVSVKSETFQTNNATYMEWFRKYQCAAFKMLCAILSNTQHQLKLYENWVFVERNWWNMINTTDSNLYTNQTLEVDKRPQIKERMVSIRQVKKNVDDGAESRKYIESQNVFESSLSQDVTKIDLSNAYVRTVMEVENQHRIGNYQPKTLMLETNSINDHEAMATVCAVIDHMFENSITPINEDGTLRCTKLGWVEHIATVIANKNNNIHINIRIFFVTVIDNCSKWFRNYADVMTPAIVKFLVDWTSSCGSIDALTIFLLVDVLEWDSTYQITENSSIDEQKLASDLMANLMSRAYNPQREVFRRNLELIRNLMERWHLFISLPHQLLLEKMSDSNVESKTNICGIQLNGIVLANKRVPWTDETRNPFLKAISACLNNNHSDVYQSAAQVLGMILKEIIDNQNNGVIDSETGEFMKLLVNRLNAWKQSNEKKFMYILFYIDKYYVVNEFITSISSLIASSTSDMKRFYLQMFFARVNEAEPQDVELILLDLLNQSQEYQHQFIGLHIFNKALPNMSMNQIKRIFPRIFLFKDAKHTESRDVVYEIMKDIRKKFRSSEELHQKATEILLKGLNDIDKNLQSSVFEYWNELPELPATLSDRVLFMLRKLYSPEFLSYGVQLLIDLKSSDLKQKLLLSRGGDDDIKYTEYDINVDWKSQDSTLRVPLFTESQQKHIINDEIDPTQNYLRATQQTLHFDPTLDPSTLHQASNSFSLHSQSSLLFEAPVQVLDRRSQRVQSGEVVTRTRFSYLRERILRNKDVASRENALKAVKRREYKKMEEHQQQQRREGQVTLYRRYRFGDYPDFFINSLAFLLPLQALVKYDSILARNTFVTILNAVYFELREESKQDFLNELAKIIEVIVKQPNQCDPMLFSALTEITLTNDAKLKIDPGITTSIPNANDDMIINAILLLENELITTKGANGETWSELANMYYSLSEYDIAASIFADKIESCQIFLRAIESESNGDYQNALKSYRELINMYTDTDTNTYSVDFAYQSLFSCYEVMGRWEDLESNVIAQITDENDSQMMNFEQLWTDEWNVKFLLPHYVRSEVRTLLYTESNATRSFFANIEQWLRNSTRAEFIKKHFGEQLMVLHVANKDYLEAKVFSNQYFEGFLNDWSAMSILSEKVRNNKMMNTRRVAEIHGFADLLNRPIDDSVIAELTDRWQRTEINKTDSTQMWEALVAYRIFVTEQALEKFQPKTAPIVDRLIESMFDMQFKLNEIAVQQQNIELSNIVLRRLDSFRNVYGRNTPKSVVQYELATVKQQQIMWMNEKNLDPNIALTNLLDIWSNLRQLHYGRRNILDTNPDIQIKIMEQFNQITDNTNDIISKCKTIDQTEKLKIAEFTGSCHFDDCKWISTTLNI